MSQLVLRIAKIDQIDYPENMTELWRQEMPEPNLLKMEPEHYLNEMESQVEEAGVKLMRQMLIEQWKLSDQMVVEQFPVNDN